MLHSTDCSSSPTSPVPSLLFYLPRSHNHTSKFLHMAYQRNTFTLYRLDRPIYSIERGNHLVRELYPESLFTKYKRDRNFSLPVSTLHCLDVHTQRLRFEIR